MFFPFARENNQQINIEVVLSPTVYGICVAVWTAYKYFVRH